MKLFIVLSFGVTFAVAANEVKHTNVGDRQMERKIIDGGRANLGEFPYQALIMLSYNDSEYVCGGSILNNRWILTAAHCFNNATILYVQLGVTDMSQPTGQSFAVIDKQVHPDYNPKISKNDVALLMLDRDIVYDKTIRPIRISNANDYLTENIRLRISGWGTTVLHGLASRYLKYSDVISITNDECKKYRYAYRVQNFHVCAIRSTGRPCHGDSGGPLVKIGVDGIPIQVGIVSFGDFHCADNYPTVYSRISYFLPFIRKYVKSVLTN